MKWIEDNCSKDEMRKTRRRALDAVSLVRHGTIMDSHCPQMLMFKKADLDVQRESLSAYTAAPAHDLKSISASAKRFLVRSANQTSPPTQLVDADTSEHDAILDELEYELDRYLHEPRMEEFKKVVWHSESGDEEVVVCCNPLQYWTARIFPCFNFQFSSVYAVC